MGCCSSSEASGQNVVTDKKPTTTSSNKEQPVDKKAASKPMTTETTSKVTPSSVKASGGKLAPNKSAQAAPAPGVKQVRAAYSGKGWAPPQKEWDSKKTEKGDKTKIEIEDEWDDDGNLKRTIIKKTTTPDWKFKTEKTVEVYSAAEAEKLGLGRK